MNIYELSKKELTKLEKEFSKTAFGQKVRLPVLISLMSMIIWLIVMIAMMIINYNCCLWAMRSGYGKCYSVISFDAAACVTSFILIVVMCIFSAANYNKELRKFVSSKQ